jgi:hypothetical protein
MIAFPNTNKKLPRMPAAPLLRSVRQPYLCLFARPCGQNRLILGFNSMVDDI